MTVYYHHGKPFIISKKWKKMTKDFQRKMIEVCDSKIKLKGDSVGLSFYAFFSNKNNDPELLIEVATWWIKTHKLDHFEKALKIKDILKALEGEL